MAHFSDRLKLLRREHNLSQMELARQLGCVSKSSVNMYERGEREPSFETLEAIADYFNVTYSGVGESFANTVFVD